MKDTPKKAGLPGDPIEFQVMNEIGIINQLAENLFREHLPKGMTVAQFGVLNHLLRLERQETISELARNMQVTQPTMSSTVRKLEDRGLIELVHDPDDRRVRRVQVTPAGAAARQIAVNQVAPVAELLRDKIPTSVWTGLLPELARVRTFLDQLRD
ncbi:MAG: MarR family transcriptional regulator [Pseudomonadota bacterium]